MAKDTPPGNLVKGNLPGQWLEPSTEAQINRLSELNEQLDLPERYYPMVREWLGTSAGVRRAIALFEKYGTPKR